MTIHVPHNVPHNPNYIDEPTPPPPVQRPPRKANAGKWHKVQQASLVQQPAKPAFGRLVAEFGMLVGWLAMWLLNGAAPAFGFALLGMLAQQRGLAVGLDRQSWLVIGACSHLFISAIEQHLWRSGCCTNDCCCTLCHLPALALRGGRGTTGGGVGSSI